MATFKLGAIVTNIAGSIGGTTFKRQPNGLVAMNKVKGTSYSRLLKNQRLSQLANIFGQWSFLDNDTKTQWNEQALLFTFPDKFGELRNISGRQLYIKLNAQNMVSGLPAPDVATLSSLVPAIELVSATIAPIARLAGVFIGEIVAESGCVALISAEVATRLRSPTYIARKVITSVAYTGTGSYDIATGFFDAFPWITDDYQVRIYVQMQNASSFKGVMTSINADVFG